MRTLVILGSLLAIAGAAVFLARILCESSSRQQAAEARHARERIRDRALRVVGDLDASGRTGVA